MISEYGVTSNGSVADTPANAHAVMLRTELPQASRDVMPASASRRITSSASCTLTKWNCMFCRVVMCPKPREYSLGDVGQRVELLGRQDALRHLDAHHVRVVAGAGRRCRAAGGTRATGRA